MSEERMTVAGFQEYIRERYYETDAARGNGGTFLWFMEEVGELASALGTGDYDNLKEEFADVAAWLMTLANINGVDMEEALRAKYPEGEWPTETK